MTLVNWLQLSLIPFQLGIIICMGLDIYRDWRLRDKPWHLWFAWHPVRINGSLSTLPERKNILIWGKYVYRRKVRYGMMYCTSFDIITGEYFPQ